MQGNIVPFYHHRSDPRGAGGHATAPQVSESAEGRILGIKKKSRGIGCALSHTAPSYHPRAAAPCPTRDRLCVQVCPSPSCFLAPRTGD